MAEARIDAETRTEFGKGAARRTRRAGKIPAVLYGHGTDPQHLALPELEFKRVLREQGRNAVVTLNIGGTPQLALTKTVVAHPIRPYIEHIDLLVIRRGEKVVVEVGSRSSPATPRPGTLVTQELNSIELEADVSSIPEQIEVSVEGLRDRHPDPGLGRHAARGHLAAHRPRDPGGQRRRRADRGPAGGRARHRGRRRRRGRAGVGRPTPTAGRRRGLGQLIRGRRSRAGGRAGQPRPGLRRHPAQRRVRGGRAAGGAGRRRPVRQAPHQRRRARGPAGRAPGGAGQAAHLHERLRRPGRRAGPVLLGAGRGPARRARRPRPRLRRGPAQARRRRGRAQRAALDQHVARHQGLPAGAVRHRPPARPAGPGRLRAEAVLRPPSARSWTLAVDLAADAAEALLADGLEPAQNRFHALSG